MSHAVALANALAAISWSPEIRNILALLVGLAVLCGSVYLLLATNTGARLGLLIALASLFGWMTIMGLIWWMYGIGMKGTAAHWEVQDIVRNDPSASAIEAAHTLPLPAELPDPGALVAQSDELQSEFLGRNPTLGDVLEVAPELRDDLVLDEQTGGWELLITSDPQRGDAAATADAAIGRDGAEIFETSADYKVLDVYSLGGKDRLEAGANLLERVEHKLLSIWHWRHPPHYAAVQVQRVHEQEVELGEAPSPPAVDPSADVISVVMIRDLGDLRFPAAMVTIVFGFLFALTCWRLHARDKLVTQNRSAALV